MSRKLIIVLAFALGIFMASGAMASATQRASPVDIVVIAFDHFMGEVIVTNAAYVSGMTTREMTPDFSESIIARTRAKTFMIPIVEKGYVAGNHTKIAATPAIGTITYTRPPAIETVYRTLLAQTPSAYIYGYAIIVQHAGANVAESRGYSLIIMPKMTALREQEAAYHKDLAATYWMAVNIRPAPCNLSAMTMIALTHRQAAVFNQGGAVTKFIPSTPSAEVIANHTVRTIMAGHLQV